MKQALIYTRVSSDQQAAFGYSLQTQLEACRQYAQQSGFTVAAEMTDDCSGSIPIVDRPGGKLLHKRLDQGNIQAVILYTHDRTARDERVIEYILFKSTLSDRGIELHYSDTGLDPYTMEGNLIGYIKAHAAAEERRKIKERSIRGKKAKARSGKWMGNIAPFGYCKIGKGREARLEINAKEADIVKRIFDIYLGRNGQQRKGSLGVASLLTAENIPSPKEGKMGWAESTILFILMNRAYIGEFSYAEITMNFPDLAIIDRETFEAAQQQRGLNRQWSKRNRKHDYLLVGGFLYCSCGYRMSARVLYQKKKGQSEKKAHHYYLCNNRRNHPHSCKAKSIRQEIVDGPVWEWVYNLLADEANLEAGLNQMLEQRELELTPKRERLATINQLYSKLERQVSELVLALREAATHQVVSATIRKQLKEIGNQLDGLGQQRDRIQAEIDIGALSMEELDQIRRVGAELSGELQNADFETKRDMLEQLQVRVDIQDEGDERELAISCGLGISSIANNVSVSRRYATRRYRGGQGERGRGGEGERGRGGEGEQRRGGAGERGSRGDR
jgi:site-specific DNA recombinase